MANQLLQNISSNTLSKIKFVKDLDQIKIDTITNGLISIHSSWSAQSIVNGKSILSTLDTLNLGEFSIQIIDNNLINPDTQFEKLGLKSHGYFESVWIKNGNISYYFKNGAVEKELLKFKEYLLTQ
jgi:hypothetical protein|tara:strand:+ start:58 stop:435 length:378 start_codon:yes stop_codon:yes gene_type:complete